MNYGVCLIAVGHDCFNEYAYNLCASIKNVDENVEVCLFTDKEYIKNIDKYSIFNQIKLLEHHHTHTLGRLNICKLKLLIEKLTPYDFTIYLDSNCLWISKEKISNI